MPDVEITNIDVFDVWAMRISEEGYGSITEIKNLDSGTFMNLIHRIKFLTDYKQAVNELNRKT